MLCLKHNNNQRIKNMCTQEAIEIAHEMNIDLDQMYSFKENLLQLYVDINQGFFAVDLAGQYCDYVEEYIQDTFFPQLTLEQFRKIDFMTKLKTKEALDKIHDHFCSAETAYETELEETIDQASDNAEYASFCRSHMYI